MKRNNQRGSALIFALILILVLSAMAGSLMFLSKSESMSSMNYRMMTQARYGAEAGVHAAANFLMSAAYVPPVGVPATNTFINYNVNVYPVTDANNNPIYLSTLSTQPSNYPDAAMVTAFGNNVNGQLQAGAFTVNYTASAQLMSMVSIVPFGTTTPTTVQTWQIKAHGDVAGVANAEAEVMTTLERYISPAFAYAAFADSNQCQALDFTGNGSTDSYDSTTLSVVGGVVQAPSGAQINTNWGGNVGTNGNETNSGGNATIGGTLSVPNPTTGVCTSGNVTGLTGNINQIKGGFAQLPSPVTFPPPNIPVPLAGTPNTFPGCTLNPCDVKLTTGITLTSGTYTVNSLSMSGNGQINISPDANGDPIILNIVNAPTAQNNQNSPLSITGNAINNPTYDPSKFQILCCAVDDPNSPPNITIAGNGASAAVVYAPGTTADFKGNGSFFGSVIAQNLKDVGNGTINYDLKLKKKLFTVGNYVLNSFTWNKY